MNFFPIVRFVYFLFDDVVVGRSGFCWITLKEEEQNETSFDRKLRLSWNIFVSIYLSLYLSTYPSIYLAVFLSINWPLPFPKFQYIIAADPGAGIGLVKPYRAKFDQGRRRWEMNFFNNSHWVAFIGVTKCSKTLTSANSMQVSNIQSYAISGSNH